MGCSVVSGTAIPQLVGAPQLDAGAQTLLLLSQHTKLFLFPGENSSKPRKSAWSWLSVKGSMPSVPQTEVPGGAAANPVTSWSKRGGSLRASVAARVRVGVKLAVGSGR